MLVDPDDGDVIAISLAVVKVYDVTNADPADGSGAIALPDVAADADGHVAAGTLSVAVGRIVRFAWSRAADGMCGFAEQVTS